MFVVVRRSLGLVSRPFVVLAGSAALLAALAGLPAQATAQSLLEQLFGLAPKPSYRAPPVVVAVPRPHSSVYRPGYDGAEERGSSERRGGSYRTVCVRLCDGAYFPISSSAQRSHMHGDADVCRNRCWGTEARLFYHHNAADMKEAVDLAGRSYKSLPTAFVFRKKLVDGCACKPAPWSAAELDRHRRYAIAEGRVPPAQAPGSVGAVVIAGNYPEVKTEAARVEPAAASEPAGEIDGIAVGNVPAVAPPIPQMAQAELSSHTRIGERVERHERRETRYEARLEPKPRGEPRQAQPIRSQAEPPAWKVVKQAPAPSYAAQPAERRPARAPSTATLYGAPGGKLVWPGDAPTRYR